MEERATVIPATNCSRDRMSQNEASRDLHSVFELSAVKHRAMKMRTVNIHWQGTGQIEYKSHGPATFANGSAHDGIIPGNKLNAKIITEIVKKSQSSIYASWRNGWQIEI